MHFKKFILIAALALLAPTFAFAGSKFSFSLNVAPFFPSVAFAPPCPPPVYVDHYYYPHFAPPVVPCQPPRPAARPMVREYHYTEYHHYYPFAE